MAHSMRCALGLLLASCCLGADVARADEPAPSLASPPSAAGAQGADCALEVTRRAQAYYDRISDFEAEFEQVTQSVAMGGGAAGQEAARGRVVMAKPGKMRWEYLKPQESLVLSNGSDLWIYDVAAKEAQHMVASGGFLSGAALQFLMGRGVIEEDFAVTSESCSFEMPVVVVKLLPRKAASYECLELHIDPATGEIKSTILLDFFGNRTSISFAATQVDRNPPPETFHFEPPPGVDVIELTPPN